MTGNEYQKLAARTIGEKRNERDMLTLAALGLCGESGEVCDHIKKYLYHGHELKKEELIKELGDVAWYLAEAATALEIPLEEVFEKNIEKLKKRYPEGFSEEASINRKE